MASIVILEDDTALSETLRLHLSSEGYSVRVAADATEGIRAIMAEVPDLILSDISLPYMGGFELLEVLQRDETTQSVPVILLTGLRDDESYMKGMQLGASSYLTKPVSREDLLEAIAAALRTANKKKPKT
jgi:DNA-binding response OmpR family regulator